MSVFRLVVCEIAHRKLGFLLGVFAVLVAVSCLVAAVTLLAAHEQQTVSMLAAHEAATKERLAGFEDDYRKITKGLGFNLLVLPREQNLGDFYADDYATKTMPEEYATRIARAKVLTVNHVLPMLQRKVKWPERDRTILLVGVRGEVYIQSAKQKPILEAVPAGSMVVGHELHRSLKLKKGDKVTLLGREFSVARLQPERGNRDDITVWINLPEAQELLDQPGQINGILALECGCEPDTLARIREEVGGLLPDTQVVEFRTQAVARAEARNRAEREARESLESLLASRNDLHRQREAFAALLTSIVTLTAVGVVAVLTLANVRQRRAEIGVLRALGVRSAQILLLVLGKALLTGLLGGALGLGIGLAAAQLLREPGALATPFDPVLAGWVVVGAAGVAALAAWLPALLAARQDPAVILREE